MILVKGQFPLIHDNAGLIASFHPAWLEASLIEAARKAGWDHWWISKDVATAACLYLQEHRSNTSVSLETFESMMRQALHHIGYPEVAGIFRMQHPVQQFSLLYCLNQPPFRNEKVFFERLQAKIKEYHRLAVQRLDLSDLSACEETLLSADQLFSGQTPGETRNRIVVFVRRQIACLSWAQPMRCSIS